MEMRIKLVRTSITRCFLALSTPCRSGVSIGIPMNLYARWEEGVGSVIHYRARMLSLKTCWTITTEQVNRYCDRGVFPHAISGRLALVLGHYD